MSKVTVTSFETRQGGFNADISVTGGNISASFSNSNTLGLIGGYTHAVLSPDTAISLAADLLQAACEAKKFQPPPPSKKRRGLL